MRDKGQTHTHHMWTGQVEAAATAQVMTTVKEMDVVTWMTEYENLQQGTVHLKLSRRRNTERKNMEARLTTQQQNLAMGAACQNVRTWEAKVRGH